MRMAPVVNLLQTNRFEGGLGRGLRSLEPRRRSQEVTRVCSERVIQWLGAATDVFFLPRSREGVRNSVDAVAEKVSL
jgi:hypothetical protein